MRFQTASDFNFGCSAPGCETMTDAIAYTSDYSVGVVSAVCQMVDQDFLEWKFVRPDGSVIGQVDGIWFRWDAATQCWFDVNGNTGACGGGCWTFLEGYRTNCDETGAWTAQVWDNGSVAVSLPFTMTRGGPLGITSPTDNQLFQLTQQNYIASDTVPFTGTTDSGSSINWTATLHYLTSGGYGGPDPAARTFTTASGAEHDETYQSIGGQLRVTARTTANGRTLQDCVTFYVEGPETGIPNPTITTRLDTLYPQSQSSPSGGTPNLMTGVAMHESSYHQFLRPSEGDADLFNLYSTLGIAAKWPYESQGNGGRYIGLMMVQTTNPDAWNWLTNTTDAINLFSGTVSPNKMSLAITYENYIINGVRNPKIPGHIGLRSLTSVQRENNALVLYSGIGMVSDLATTLTRLYYAPVCSSGVVVSTNKGLECHGGSWNWVVNDQPSGNPDAVNYVSGTSPPGVRNQLQ
jgi:hypothetical protein